MYAPILRLYRDAGKVALTDDELAAVECYSKELPSLILQNQQSEENRQVEAPEADECVLQGGKIFEREDIKAVLLEMGPMLSLYKTHNILDSLGCDQDLRDIIMAGEFYNSLDHERTPLSETAMKFMEDNTKMQFAKVFIKAEQEKFLALQRRDISNSDNLKSAEDVANLSDGEQILPVIYSDNYFNLLSAGHSRTIDIEWKAEDTRGTSPVVEITGTNVPKMTVKL